jgi:hypothetical protein
MAALGRAHAGLPEDLLNFQYDPVACAVALGWPGATVSHRRIRPQLVGDDLLFRLDEGQSLARVVDSVDGQLFTRDWLDAVTSVGPTASPPD